MVLNLHNSLLFTSPYIEYIDVEASILWPPDAKSQLIGKDPDAGKIEGKG